MVPTDWGQESQASSWVEAWNSACLSRCPRGERPLVELYLEPGVFSERCTERLPLRLDCIHRLEFGVNLGNPGEFTMLQLAEKVIELTGSKSKIVYLPLPQDDPTQRKPVIDLAKKELGWEPTIPLEEGLKKTIEYFKHTLEI